MLIKRDKSIIPACDVEDMKKLIELIEATHDLEIIGGYKIGISLILNYGLGPVVRRIKAFTEKPIIYDHQKAGNDIPEIGDNFAKICKDNGVDAVILFPFVGPISAERWIEQCQKEELEVIVGGRMTHPGFETFIPVNTSFIIYETAVVLGVNNFIIPGTYPGDMKYYRNIIIEKRMEIALGKKEEISEKVKKFDVFSPGLITQGGNITEVGRVAGDRWHAIIGRALYQASNIRNKTIELSKDL